MIDPPIRLDAEGAFDLPPLEIFLDGVKQSRVTRYDIEAGELERFVIDRNHNVLKDPIEPDQWLLQTCRGRIEVKWK